MLLGITDKETGKKYHICGGFPSASGKTNLAMTLAPDALGDRYYVEFYGDDIAWLWVGDDGKLYGMNPEFGVFGVAKDTNEHTNPTAIDSIVPGHRRDLHERRLQREDPRGLVGGQGDDRPADLDGWLDWKGDAIADRAPENVDEPWAHPNSRFTTTLANVPNVADDFEDPNGVPIDAHHLRWPHPRPRAADPRDHRRRRGRVRRSDAGRRGDRGRRRARGRAALRPDVDASVHVLPRGATTPPTG